MRYNENFNRLSDSYVFTRINKSVKEKRKEGKRIIDLGVGDVKLPLFPSAVTAMEKAAKELGEEKSFKGYLPSEGLISLREKISCDYAENGADISADEIFISDGAKSDVGNLLELFGKGSKVLIPTPCYPAYAEANALYGNDVTFLPCMSDDGFIPYPPYKRTYDIIYLCSPNNPTGAVMTKKELKNWVDYALLIGAVIIFDGAYEEFISGDLPKSIYEVEGAKYCAIEVRSFSKSSGFTGVRCGYCVIPKSLGLCNELWKRRLGSRFNGVSYITQKGAEAYYSKEGKEAAKERIEFYKANAEILKIALKNKNFRCNADNSSPYVFAKCNDKNDVKFCELLIDKLGIAATPGSGFGSGGEGYFRLSAFPKREEILLAADLISDFAF